MSDFKGGKGEEAEVNYALPETAVTLNGLQYSPMDDHWSFETDERYYHFKFSQFEIIQGLLNCFKAFCMSRLATRNIGSIMAEYAQLCWFFLTISKAEPQLAVIDKRHVLNYRTSLTRKTLYRSGVVNRVLQSWAKAGIPGVTADAQFTAAVLPNPTAKRPSVLSLLDKKDGAYTHLEDEGLQKAAHAGFSENALTLQSYSLCLLSAALAPRPIQFSMMRVCDLIITEKDGVKQYTLKVPRAKGRGQDSRSSFTDRFLIQEIGMLLEAQARLVKRQAAVIGMRCVDDAPLFPTVYGNGKFRVRNNRLVPTKAEAIGRHIKRALESFHVKSERTGETINAHATRARKTLGTRAAAAGKTLAEIAKLLDHSTLSSAHHYVQVVKELLVPIDEKLAIELAPLAQRFAGSVALKTASEGDNIKRVLGSPSLGEAPADMGGCGKFSQCGLGKPTACYTCRLFRPWVDGPHESVLKELIERRKRLVSDGSEVVARTLDDTILACADVVRQCRLLKGSANG